MSFDLTSIDSKIKTHTVVITVRKNNALIRLANTLPWDEMVEIVLPDLKRTTAKGFWNLGRKLYVRTHLGIFVLQALEKKTDIAIVKEISENAVYQLFCGSSIIKNWKCPHANKVQAFRSRLSPETQMSLNEVVVRLAVSEGAANPEDMDIDSTVQEANISYPADARLLLKLSEKCQKIVNAFRLKIPFDLKQIRSFAQKYFFAPKNKSIDERREIFKQYYKKVKTSTAGIIAWAEEKMKSGAQSLRWNVRRHLEHVGGKGRKYLNDVAYFIETHKLKTGKILSFHASQVACIRKGKIGKLHEFGRVLQLARLKGNFLLGLHTAEVNFSDKLAVEPMIKKHVQLFGKGVLKSLGTDKGYYKAINILIAQQAKVREIGIQAPASVKRIINKTNPTIQERLRSRRAGIEPLIGHAKRFGLGKSKMKSDEATHASGFRALMGFNLSQLRRFQEGKIKKKAA